MLILNRRDVESLLTMPACIGLMERALASLARGEVILPLRPVIRIPESPNALAVMPAYSAALRASAAKLISIYPGNHGTALDSHQGMVALFDGANGRPLALMDAVSITAIRTAAVSAVATQLLAIPDATTVGILGAGTQGRSHVDAMLAVRRVQKVYIWSRTSEHARALASEMSNQHRAEFIVARSARQAVEASEIVCTATASREPIVMGEWLRPGTHVNAVGASLPTTRELDTDAVRRSRVFVDRRESALHEAGDLIIPMKEGQFSASQIVAEIGDVLIGKSGGREREQDVTLFKSLGLAIEDLACAHHLHALATQEKRGTHVEL